MDPRNADVSGGSSELPGPMEGMVWTLDDLERGRTTPACQEEGKFFGKEPKEN